MQHTMMLITATTITMMTMMMMVPNPTLCYAMRAHHSSFYDYCNLDDDDCITIVIIVISSGDKHDDIKLIDNM